MLSIRNEQYALMSRYAFDQFLVRMERHLSAGYPNERRQIGEARLREFIAAGIDQARSHAITDENDVKRYLEYLVRFGLDFGKSPRTSWAQPFLVDKQLTGTEKMNKVDEYELFVLTLGK